MFMNIREGIIHVSHINVRTSMSLLLVKLLSLEVITGITVILFHVSVFLFPVQLFLRQGKSLIIPLFVLVVLLKSFLIFYAIAQWLNEYYEITQTKIYHRKGIIFKTEESFPIERIAFVEVYQGLFGKLCNFGTIVLYDQRRNKYEDMYLIHNPIRYAEIIEHIIPDVADKKYIVREHLIERGIEVAL